MFSEWAASTCSPSTSKPPSSSVRQSGTTHGQGHLFNVCLFVCLFVCLMSIYQKKIITSGCRLWPSTCVSNYRYPTQVPARLLPKQWRWKTPDSVFQICMGCHRTAPGEKIRVCQIWLLVWPFIWLLIWSFIWLLIWISLSTCIWV